MNIEEYINYIDNKLDNLLDKMDADKYVTFIEENPCLNTYDTMLAVYETYENIPKELKRIFNIPFLKCIKEDIDKV
ncbi:MAG: hypothetical protein GX951_04885 [Mollicutes bacterium]|nr:hypothetical protein [Mollicutes bacterium]